jgi:hypothetical protein
VNELKFQSELLTDEHLLWTGQRVFGLAMSARKELPVG